MSDPYRSTAPPAHRRYDVVVAGARCAGSSTAMLLARRGLKVLVVDPVDEGRDTLSTHALMWGGVLQLHRWGLLDAVRAAGTPLVPSTTFYYGDQRIHIPLKPRDGVEGLYAPRRTVLDPILVDGARKAGAEVAYGLSVTDLLRDADGRVRGAVVSDRDRRALEVRADLVIGADGVRSRVARLAGAEVEHAGSHAGASVYGYFQGVGLEGYHWFYVEGSGVGAIPTNDDATCIFALLPAARFAASLQSSEGGTEAVFYEVLREASPDLAARVRRAHPRGKLRAFAGLPGFFRRSVGPGWALVGDAGYFKDPITAHGITDALRDAELLARAVTHGGAGELLDYQLQRDALSRELMEVTDRIAAFDWTLEEVQALHLALSAEMKREVEWMAGWSREAAIAAGPSVPPPPP